MTEKTQVRTVQAPAPAAAYSQGVRKGPIIQVSGQVSVDPATNQLLHSGDVAAQTTQVLENVHAVIEASGATFDDIVMLRVYLTSRDDFAAMNDAFAEFVRAQTPSGVLPARTTVITGLPAADLLVEIDALAITS
ncbi:RidA family protein [Rhodococcus koreensis]